MLRDQCEAYCQCSFCKKNKRKEGSRDHTFVPSARIVGQNKDELYLRTLNESLRSKCLMDSSRNAHKFRPDEVLQSTRGEIARAALTIPVRRRDRLQELLILQNKARIKAERQLRRERRAAGLPDAESEMCDRAVGTADDASVVGGVRFLENGEEAKKQHAADVVVRPACSAEEDLLYALRTIKQVTDEHGDGNMDQPLTAEQVNKLRNLLEEQDEKTKKMIADCPEKEHRYVYSSSVNRKKGEKGYKQDTFFPSINKRTAQRINYNPHPYGSGVVWVPLARQNEDAVVEKRGNGEANDDAYENFQYVGSTHNKYNYAPAAKKVSQNDKEAQRTVAHRADLHDVKSKEQVKNGETAKEGQDVKANGTKVKMPYKSSAALWRTTNQEQAAQMQRFLDFKKLYDTASKVYAESAVKRNANNFPLVAAANGGK